ncbi:ABC transporter permease [Mycoplasmopsis ciconiae]|uniref:ABC transporter permease n=1 Tax=Mycoplasmopsis ciconiae TaxID=561067 RepID=A0ABU7MLZ2_9BACT|nr:ABC transporter permease [Mycoplasmopsis ciconiae]
MTFNIKKLPSTLSSFITLEDKQKGRKKVYASLWAIFFGFLIASIIYWIKGTTGVAPQNTNIFSFVTYLFEGAFGVGSRTTARIIKNFLILFVFFGFSGLAIVISFKSGLFNIGAQGQMLLPAILFFAILILNRANFSEISLAYLVAMFFVFIMGGMLLGAISGFLKAFFNVHEVISTIFLNWIMIFISAWLFTRSNYVLIPNDGTVNPNKYFSALNGTISIFIESSVVNVFIYFGVALVILMAIIFWFVYSKTSIGYKLKMVGLNKSNAKYVGINEKLIVVLVMAISGALSGLAGFYYYIIYSKKVDGQSSPLGISFEGIAIALIALNSPIGSLFASGLYAVIYNGQTSFALKKGSESVDSNFFALLTGLIIFMAALSLMFYKFRPLRSIFKYSLFFTNGEYWLNFKTYHISNLKYIRKERFKVVKAYFKEIKVKFKIKKEQTEYLKKVNALIKQTKTTDSQQTIDIYSQISKQRIEFNQLMYDKGLGIYKELKNKYKSIKSDKKKQYKIFKEYLYKNLTNKYFHKLIPSAVKEVQE